MLRAAGRRFADAGVDATSLEDIRHDVQVSTGSLYHHFPSKAHLVAAVHLETLRRYQDDFLAELSAHTAAEDGVHAMVGFHLRWCVDRADEARLLLRERTPGSESPAAATLEEANSRFFEEAMAWWRPHVHYGVLRDLPAHEIYVLWLGPAQELCRLWLSGRSLPVPTESAELLGRMSWLALRAEAASPSGTATGGGGG